MYPKMMLFFVDDILMVALIFSNSWGPSTVGVGFSTRRRSPEQGGVWHTSHIWSNTATGTLHTFKCSSYTIHFKYSITPTHITSAHALHTAHTSTFSMSILTSLPTHTHTPNKSYAAHESRHMPTKCSKSTPVSAPVECLTSG